MDNPELQGRYWDHITEQAPAIADAIQLINAVLPTDIRATFPNRDALDAGCGAGDHAAALGQVGSRSVTAFDVSVGRMQLAIGKSPAGHFSQASMSELPYRSESFDLVWAWGILHYVPDPVAALHEVARTLRPGGVVLIHTLRRGFWSHFEFNTANILSRTPRWLQNVLLAVGEQLINLISRLITGRRPIDQTDKTVRQKMQERLFVPAKMSMFSLDDLARGLGSAFDVHEVAAPVTDLLKRNMSITVVARKR
jgi:ubiquinone/menaquinone biosynthesis C-methylase UbiE